MLAGDISRWLWFSARQGRLWAGTNVSRRRWALAVLLVLPACSLAYLTDRAGDAGSVDAAGDGASAGMPMEGASAGMPIDGGASEVGAESVADDVDAGWSPFVDASTGFADLGAVWGSAPQDVWAVGYNMIVHWDGSRWSISPANVGPLSGVWGSSRTDVWAVGQAGAIYRYDGTAWLPYDAGTHAALTAVWGSASDDVWAAGEQDGGGPILHWDGGGWALSATFDAGLDSVWGSSGLVWTAGSAGHIWELKGGSWAPQDDQASGREDLTGLWGSGPTSVWAVSANGPAAFYGGNQDAWVAAASVSGLNAVWGTGADDIWGVGFGGTIVHYDGSAWKPVTSGTTSALTGVWGSGPNDVWAVGTGGTILHHP